MKTRAPARIPDGYRRGLSVENESKSKESSCSPVAASRMHTGTEKIFLDTPSACDANTLALLFGGIYKMVNTMPESLQKNEAMLAVAGLEAEARKGDSASSKIMKDQFNILMNTCTDAWKEAVETFTIPRPGVNPLLQSVASMLKTVE